MYGKTIDSKHLHERTGSHSTKGTGSGTVWWGQTDCDKVQTAMSLVKLEYNRLISGRDECNRLGDRRGARAYNLEARPLRRYYKRLSRELGEVLKLKDPSGKRSKNLEGRRIRKTLKPLTPA